MMFHSCQVLPIREAIWFMADGVLITPSPSHVAIRGTNTLEKAAVTFLLDDTLCEPQPRINWVVFVDDEVRKGQNVSVIDNEQMSNWFWVELAT